MKCPTTASPGQRSLPPPTLNMAHLFLLSSFIGTFPKVPSRSLGCTIVGIKHPQLFLSALQPPTISVGHLRQDICPSGLPSSFSSQVLSVCAQLNWPNLHSLILPCLLQKFSLTPLVSSPLTCTIISMLSSRSHSVLPWWRSG